MENSRPNQKGYHWRKKLIDWVGSCFGAWTTHGIISTIVDRITNSDCGKPNSEGKIVWWVLDGIIFVCHRKHKKIFCTSINKRLLSWPDDEVVCKKRLFRVPLGQQKSLCERFRRVFDIFFTQILSWSSLYVPESVGMGMIFGGRFFGGLSPKAYTLLERYFISV